MTALTDSHIFVGNSSNVATDVAMSGDATIDDTGAVTVAIGLDKLSDVRYDTSSAANLIIGQKVTLFPGAQQNVFIGELAGATAANSTSNTSQNTAVGFQAMQGLTSGQQNTALGCWAGKGITTGYYNTAIGEETLKANTTGIANTAIGYQSLLANVSGQNNVGIAPFALTASTGSNNIGIGYNTGATLTTGSSNIVIGNNADVPTPSTSNYLNIGGVITATGMNTPSTSTVTVPGALTVTGHTTFEGVTSTGATGTGKLVYDTSPTLTTAALGSSTATTQSAGDNSTKIATTAYVDSAIAAYSATFNNQSGTTYTLASTDTGKTVTLNNASAITVTLPNSLSAGFTCECIQLGAGQVTFSAASGATLKNRQSFTKIAGQNGAVRLVVTGNSGGTSAVYNLAGDAV